MHPYFHRNTAAPSQCHLPEFKKSPKKLFRKVKDKVQEIHYDHKIRNLRKHLHRINRSKSRHGAPSVKHLKSFYHYIKEKIVNSNKYKEAKSEFQTLKYNIQTTLFPNSPSTYQKLKHEYYAGLKYKCKDRRRHSKYIAAVKHQDQLSMKRALIQDKEDRKVRQKMTKKASERAYKTAVWKARKMYPTKFFREKIKSFKEKSKSTFCQVLRLVGQTTMAVRIERAGWFVDEYDRIAKARVKREKEQTKIEKKLKNSKKSVTFYPYSPIRYFSVEHGDENETEDERSFIIAEENDDEWIDDDENGWDFSVDEENNNHDQSSNKDIDQEIHGMNEDDGYYSASPSSTCDPLLESTDSYQNREQQVEADGSSPINVLQDITNINTNTNNLNNNTHELETIPEGNEEEDIASEELQQLANTSEQLIVLLDSMTENHSTKEETQVIANEEKENMIPDALLS